MKKTAKNIIVTGLLAELTAIVTAIISAYKIQLIYEMFGHGTYGIDTALESMYIEFIKFWPIFLAIAVATFVAGLVVSIKKKTT